MKQFHYQITAFECDICRKETRILCDIGENFSACSSCANGTTWHPRTCAHCGTVCQGIGIVERYEYPLAESATQTDPGDQFFSEEIMRESHAERWCETCIAELLAQAERGEVDVWDALTMDTD